VKDLAGVSHDYVGTIFDTINNNPDSWKNDSDVVDATENVLVKTGYYNRRFLYEIFRAYTIRKHFSLSDCSPAMNTTTTIDRRRIDAAITGFAVIGGLLAIGRGLRILKFGNLDFVLTIGFPAVIATLAYLHYDRSEQPAVAVGLGLWGVVAGAVALFGSFFLVIDNPATVSDAPLSSSLFASGVANFTLGVIALSGLYAAAGYYKSRAVVLLAPVTQLVAFVVASSLVRLVV